MQLYWSLKSIPELSLLPKAERKRVWRAAYRQTLYHSWQLWFSLFGVSLLAGIGDYAGSRVGAMIGAGIGGLFFGQVISALSRPYIRDILSAESGH